MPPYIDSHLKRFISKKFFMAGIATLLLWIGKIEPDHWALFCGVWVGTQAVIDAVSKRYTNDR